MSSVIARIIPSTEVGRIWGDIEAWVKSSLGSDKSFNSDDIRAACEGGNITLWVIQNDGVLTGFLIGTINDNPRARTYYAPWLGGENLEVWVAPAFEQLKAYLRNEGISSYSWIGRPAWKRLLQADSEQVFYTINLT